MARLFERIRSERGTTATELSIMGATIVGLAVLPLGYTGGQSVDSLYLAGIAISSQDTTSLSFSGKKHNSSWGGGSSESDKCPQCPSATNSGNQL